MKKYLFCKKARTVKSMNLFSPSADGSVWMLEAAINGKYKVTNRKGHVYTKYTNSLKYLIKLTDLNFAEYKIY